VILVDTSVFSLAFRRKARLSPEEPLVQTLRRLIEQDRRVGVPGIVLQELLSGVRSETEFARLRGLMEGFPLVFATREDHVAAARIFNSCREAGVIVSTVDCLIAAIAVNTRSQLLTGDEDFQRMSPHCNLKLLKLEAANSRR
jgi:predicted nucleic acid-binding protein